MIRFASLGSGSQGNALLIESSGTRVLLDCGFSIRESCHRLEKLAVAPDTLRGIVVSHEHSDHTRGVFALAKRYDLDVWITHGTLAALGAQADRDRCKVIDSHTAFRIDDLYVQPFPVPHDAREPVQFVFTDGKLRLGTLTDVGSITPHVIATISHCNALVLEFNHDPGLLAQSDYPLSLQRRIRSAYGHLSNAQAIDLLHRINHASLKYLIAAHLSEQNNRPEHVLRCIRKVWQGASDAFDVASQNLGFSWRVLE